MNGASFANFLRTALLALTEGAKPDIMKVQGYCVTMSNRREGYGEEEKMLYLHACFHDGSDRRVQPGGTVGTPARVCRL